MTYDYIIVGAGSAGCILANRLSESGKYSVLLIEAGERDASFWFKVPVGFTKTYYNRQYNWMYYSEPEAELSGRKLYCPRGKVVGGSGSINAMVYVRGQRSDFDDWAAAGNPGWSFDDVLPYFRKLESHAAAATDPEHHGAAGPIHITSMKADVHPIVHEFLKGCEQLNLPRTHDFNGAQFEGAGIYDLNTKNGERCSSSFAYLRPAESRSNLTVRSGTLVRRVQFDGKRAVGVVVAGPNGDELIGASREVILAAGAVDTPKLLQLSGVGDPTLLRRHQVPVVQALPAVGRNLQDHLCVSFYFKANRPTLNDEMGTLLGKMKIGLRYLSTKRGPLAMSVNQAGGFFRGAPDVQAPNIQLYFNPLSYRIPKSEHASIEPEPYSGFLIAFNPCRPTSRGAIEIASNRAEDAAKIHINALTTQKDLDEAVQGSKVIRSLMCAPALKAMTVEEISPGPQMQSDEDLLQYFREQSGSIYHLCGSCAMGPDAATSVVDASLRVHGLVGLRVVDASVFPNITSGNINAPTMMVAEKGADLILAAASSHAGGQCAAADQATEPVLA
ncbi:GMC family oxidoreductase N-terminal domain-containing protein [Ralstonia insidiosa]|uniref:Choline dehydrogenase n=1 Tax=Ralstonia insidiosa TaxID=190721 RepID=A0A192A6G4_9RALS|nr:GMC family oxidoreductase N-terminal domain-containing protein [Ralstonia insidiosa]ANJ76080.1 choline dehydrogenase [Ralstonia insidiosa]KAB0469052.1 choline dehydrogenase [Ralstonia insidiosa]MBY4909711.1 GMC family oxidoreductase N-terminal domain-containing protein [Ralstonia insidiosa]